MSLAAITRLTAAFSRSSPYSCPGWHDHAGGEGHIRINGRTKDVLIRDGENVPVFEVESLLSQASRRGDGGDGGRVRGTRGARWRAERQHQEVRTRGRRGSGLHADVVFQAKRKLE
ncbi:MAG: hypothetical protein Q7J84_10750 [Sulfuricaulis sp.]|nr:hypothetical protein [Sulfuricaulis sp.]